MLRRLSYLLVLVALAAGNVTAQESATPSDRATYVGMVRRAATERGLPPDLAEAVAQIESSYDPRVVGTVGEVGLMQVRHPTAQMLGFKGTVAELARPSENVRYGVAYLAGAWGLARGDVCRALMKYRAGHKAETMTPLSVTYCQRARAYLAEIGSTLATGVGPTPVAAVARPTVEPAGPARMPACQRGTPACSKLLWAAHEARVRRIVAQLQSGRRSGG
jgi:soluble lytic murein transglycosylase-like protein